MNPPDISRLSDREKAAYTEGMAIVKEKLYAARLEKPTAQEIHLRSLSIGLHEVRSKLAKARAEKEPHTPLAPSRNCYSSGGRRTISTGGINPYLQSRYGRKWLCTGSLV